MINNVCNLPFYDLVGVVLVSTIGFLIMGLILGRYVLPKQEVTEEGELKDG